MKKTSIMALFVVLLFCFSVSSAQAYTNEEYKFSIDPPSGWTVGNATAGVIVSFDGPSQGYGISINIEVESLATNMTVEQYAAAAKNVLLTTLDNYTSISTSTRVINGVDAYELVSTFTSGGIDIKLKQVLLVKTQKAYIITYGGLPTIYPQYLSIFESSVETFKIIEPTPSLSASPSPTSTPSLSASPSPSQSLSYSPSPSASEQPTSSPKSQSSLMLPLEVVVGIVAAVAIILIVALLMLKKRHVIKS